MSRSPILVTAALIASLLASASFSKGQAGAQVQEVDARFRKAMTAGDAEALKQIVAEDAKIIHGNHGGIQSKAELIGQFRSYNIERYARTPVYSHISRDMAVLVSVTHKLLHGRMIDTTTTEVFVRRADRWQILVLQNTDHAVS